MDKELNALRRVARAAKKYQENVIQKRSISAKADADIKGLGSKPGDLGTAEFELSEALNEWYRTQRKAN